MRSISNCSLPIHQVIALTQVNHRKEPFVATKNDDALSFNMATSETEAGSGLYGWGENFRVKALKFSTDPLLVSGSLIPGITSREVIKTMVLDDLNKRWSDFKAAAASSDIKGEAAIRAVAILDAFEEIYCEDGELKPIDWDTAVIVVEGHHRKKGHCLELALIECKKLGHTFLPEIPVSIVEFDNFVELRTEQARGNGAAAVHNSTSDLDLISLAVDIVQTGMSETTFRKLTGRDTGSTGRRAYAVGTLHHIVKKWGVDVFGSIIRYVEAKATMKDEDKVRKEVDNAVPLAALGNDAKNHVSNVPSIIRLLGSLTALDAFVAKAKDANEWEREAVAARKTWDETRFKEWWDTRIPFRNNGVLIQDKKPEVKADLDYITGPLAGMMGNTGAMIAKLIMSKTADRPGMAEQHFMQTNWPAFDAVLKVLQTGAGETFRNLLTEIELVASVAPDQLVGLLADYRQQIAVVASKIKDEAPKVDTSAAPEAPTTEPKEADTTATTEPKGRKTRSK